MEGASTRDCPEAAPTQRVGGGAKSGAASGAISLFLILGLAFEPLLHGLHDPVVETLTPLHRGHPDPSVNLERHRDRRALDLPGCARFPSFFTLVQIRFVSVLRRSRVQGGENAARMRESTSLLAASPPSYTIP